MMHMKLLPVIDLILSHIRFDFTDNYYDTQGYSAWLFLMQLSGIVPIFIVAKKNKSYAPIWCFLFVYFMMFFNSSLNIIRQSVAAACMLAAFVFFNENKYTKTILICLIAFIFQPEFP